MSKIINKGTGAGGANTTKNGSKFDDKICKLVSPIVLKLDLKMFRQNKIYDKINTKELSLKKVGKKMGTRKRPDIAVLNELNKTINILEIKYQTGNGSVDEKLETGIYKKDYFEELFKPYGYSITYSYILNNYFKINKYKRIIKYNKDKDIKMFIFNNKTHFQKIITKFLTK